MSTGAKGVVALHWLLAYACTLAACLAPRAGGWPVSCQGGCKLSYRFRVAEAAQTLREDILVRWQPHCRAEQLTPRPLRELM